MNQEQTETLLKQHCSITLTIALVPKSANHLVIVIYQKQKPCTGIPHVLFIYKVHLNTV